MFSSIKISRDSDRKESVGAAAPGPTSVYVAGARPLLHLRGPPMPAIPFPSVSLHVDRHKIVTSLSSCGADIEVTHVPEFTRDAISTAFDVDDRTPDVVFLCGAGTSWDNAKIIAEDGFGSAEYVDMQTLQLVIPRRPKLLIAVGAFCNEFGTTATELGVCSTVLVLDDSLPPGASDSYELISHLFKDFVRMNGQEDVPTIAKRAITTMEERRPGGPAQYARLYTALRAVAPPQRLLCNVGSCRVRDTEGSAAIRARQNPRVFRLRAFDGRSFAMWEILDVMERKCTHNRVILYGGAGCGRTELVAQMMLWYLDRSRLTCGIFANCDPQSDIAHYVHDLNSFYDLAGALLQLGMAGRQRADMRVDVLLRALKASRAVVVFDDWQCLPAQAQTELAALILKFPPAVRVIVTCRGAATCEQVARCRKLLPDAYALHVPGIESGVAERLFFEHMERSKFGQQHASYVKYQNPYHRGSKCDQLGDLSAEDTQNLTEMCSARLGLDGSVHAHSLLMLAASAASTPGGIYDVKARFEAEQRRDYSVPVDPRYGLPGSLADVEAEVLWPAMCVAHSVLSLRHRTLVAQLMQVGMPLSASELALVSGETPQAIESMCSQLVDLRLIWSTPQGILYVIPAVREAIKAHVRRRVGQGAEGGVMRAEDFYDEPWVAALTDSNHVEVLQKITKHLASTEGAWAQVACSRHMILSVTVMGVDLNEGAPEGSLTLLYVAYQSLVQRWYMEWERGGMMPPGAYEACLDGRHGACRPLPPHYNAVRDLLLDIPTLSNYKDRQIAACEVLSNMLFAVGDYDFSKRLVAYHMLLARSKPK